MSRFKSTKVIELGSTAFRQWRANHSHCRYIHGYQLKAKLWFGCNELDNKNWAVDFGGLKDLKAELKTIFDHTTTVAGDDPELETFKELDKKGIIQLRIFKDGVGIERCAELVFNVAQNHINHLTDGRCWVERVEVFEHEDNSAVYSPPPVELVQQMIEKSVENESAVETKVEVVEGPVNVPNDTSAPVGKTTTQTKGGWFNGTTWG